jgi:cytochrome c553
MTFCNRVFAVLLALSSVHSLAGQARYTTEERGRPLMPSHVNLQWQQECGSCHMAYPPGLLPSASWNKVMSGLDQHFGANALLSDSDRTVINDFLVKNASNRWTSSNAPLRITQTRWYKSRHRELSPAVFKRPSVKSHGNCSACHANAAKGVFDERGVRVPR